MGDAQGIFGTFRGYPASWSLAFRPGVQFQIAFTYILELGDTTCRHLYPSINDTYLYKYKCVYIYIYIYYIYIYIYVYTYIYIYIYMYNCITNKPSWPLAPVLDGQPCHRSDALGGTPPAQRLWKNKDHQGEGQVAQDPHQHCSLGQISMVDHPTNRK